MPCAPAAVPRYTVPFSNASTAFICLSTSVSSEAATRVCPPASTRMVVTPGLIAVHLDPHRCGSRRQAWNRRAGVEPAGRSFTNTRAPGGRTARSDRRPRFRRRVERSASDAAARAGGAVERRLSCENVGRLDVSCSVRVFRRVSVARNSNRIRSEREVAQRERRFSARASVHQHVGIRRRRSNQQIPGGCAATRARCRARWRGRRRRRRRSRFRCARRFARSRGGDPGAAGVLPGRSTVVSSTPASAPARAGDRRSQQIRHRQRGQTAKTSNIATIGHRRLVDSTGRSVCRCRGGSAGQPAKSRAAARLSASSTGRLYSHQAIDLIIDGSAGAAMPVRSADRSRDRLADRTARRRSPSSASFASSTSVAIEPDVAATAAVFRSASARISAASRSAAAKSPARSGRVSGFAARATLQSAPRGRCRAAFELVQIAPPTRVCPAAPRTRLRRENKCRTVRPARNTAAAWARFAPICRQRRDNAEAGDARSLGGDEDVAHMKRPVMHAASRGVIDCAARSTRRAPPLLRSASRPRSRNTTSSESPTAYSCARYAPPCSTPGGNRRRDIRMTDVCARSARRTRRRARPFVPA